MSSDLKPKKKRRVESTSSENITNHEGLNEIDINSNVDDENLNDNNESISHYSAMIVSDEESLASKTNNSLENSSNSKNGNKKVKQTTKNTKPKKEKPKKEPKSKKKQLNKSTNSQNSCDKSVSFCDPSSPYDIRKRSRRSIQSQPNLETNNNYESDDESDDDDFSPTQILKEFESNQFSDTKSSESSNKISPKIKLINDTQNKSSSSSNNSIRDPGSPYDVRKRPRRSIISQPTSTNLDNESTDESEDEDFHPGNSESIQILSSSENDTQNSNGINDSIRIDYEISVSKTNKLKGQKLKNGKKSTTIVKELSNSNHSICDLSSDEIPISKIIKSKGQKLINGTQNKSSSSSNYSICDPSSPYDVRKRPRRSIISQPTSTNLDNESTDESDDEDFDPSESIKDLNKSASTNSEANSSYNILHRPKRNIHFQPITARNDLNAEMSEDSEDDDYDPSKILDENDLDNFLKNGSYEVEENSSSDSSHETIKEDPKPKEEKSIPKNKENEVKDIKRKYIKKPKKESTFKNDEPKIKKRKYKKKKSPVIMSDGETQKFIKSFKNSNIIQSKSKKKPVNNLSPICQRVQSTQNSGPHIKRSAHTEHSMTYSTFSVHQSKNDFEDGHKRILVTREKIPPIFDQTSQWRCVFCHNKPKCIDGLGDLFGPYRIDKNQPEDLTIEYKNGNF